MQELIEIISTLIGAFTHAILLVLLNLSYVFILYCLYRGVSLLKIIKDKLSAIHELLKPKVATRGKFYLINNGRKEELRSMEVFGQQELEVVCEYTDAFGNVAQVEAGKIVASDASLFELQLSEDGKSAKGKCSGKAGEFHFEAEADGKLGEGEALIKLISEKITVKAGEATQGVIKVSLAVAPAPVPEPEQPAPQPEA